MDRKGRQKAAAVLTVVVLAMLTVSWCILLAAIGAPPVVVIVISVADAIMLIWLGFHCKDRLKEIDEGQEDAVDNY